MIIDSFEKWNNMLDTVRKCQYPVAYDIETEGGSEWTTKIIGVAIAISYGQSWYIPFWVFDGVELCEYLSNHQELMNELGQILLQKSLIMHGGVYDITVTFRQFGIDLTSALHADTILMKHLIDENRPFGLKDIAVKWHKRLGLSYADANAEQKDLHDSVRRNGGKLTKDCYELYKGDLHLIAKYAEQDTRLTYRLYNYCQSEFEKDHIRKELFYLKETMPLYRHFTIPAKIKGFPVDVEYFLGLQLDLQTNIAQMTKDFADLVRKDVEPLVIKNLDKLILKTPRSAYGKLLKANGITFGKETPEIASWCEDQILAHKGMSRDELFNPGSNDQVAWLLFEKYGRPVFKKSRKTQKPAADAETLKLHQDLPWVALLLKKRKEEKLLGTYVDSILDKQRNGLLSCNLFQFGTTSGRFSSSNPNMQNAPRDDKRIKLGFIAPPGYKIIEADYSALEARCFAAMSGSYELKRVYIEGLDLYSKVAIDVFKLTDCSARKKDENYLGKIYPEKRQLVKAFVLAVVYGASAGRIAGMMKMSTQEAQEIINNYLDAYPELKKYMDSMDRQARLNGYVKTICGRVRHLPAAEILWREYSKKILSRKQMEYDYGEAGIESYSKFRNNMNNAKNAPIQGLAGHLMNAALIDMCKAFKEQNVDGYIPLMVHDSAVCIVAIPDLDRAVGIVRESMENNWVTKLLDIPMVAEPEIKDRYGDK